jgi:hypothetical protein
MEGNMASDMKQDKESFGMERIKTPMHKLCL